MSARAVRTRPRLSVPTLTLLVLALVIALSYTLMTPGTWHTWRWVLVGLIGLEVIYGVVRRIVRRH